MSPADTTLGLEDSGGSSPAVQALAARAASQRPLAQTTPLLEHLAGVSLPPATLDRQAQHQGKLAQPLRPQLD